MRKLFLTAAVISFASFILPASAEDLEFMISNKSKYDINEIYASPVNADNWGEDMMDEDTVLKSGESGKATIKSGKGQCKFDLKFVFEDDGDKDETNNNVIEKNIDLCETGSYTLEDE